MSVDSITTRAVNKLAAGGAELGRFARFLARRFLADRCLETAAALSFTSVLSLVPLVAVSLAFLSAFPQFAPLRAEIEDILTANLLPHAGEAAIEQFRSFVERAGSLTGVGLIGLIITAVMVLMTINSAFDTIWRVETPRPLAIRLLAYWAVISLGPLLIGGALSLSGVLLATGEELAGGAIVGAMGWTATLIPFLLEIIAFAIVYLAAPNRRVRPRDAIFGAALAAILFEAVKRGFGLYLVHFATYDAVYGALAALPVFLIWIYLCWAATLIGAELAAALPEWRARPRT
jgi:membrane protein